MEIIEVSNQITQKIKQIDSTLNEIKKRGDEYARIKVEHEKQIAKTIIGLRNGKEYNIDDETIVNPPVTLIEKIAKGICMKTSLEAELADAMYKNSLRGIEGYKAQLMGYQSIFRHLEVEAKNGKSMY